MMMSNSFIHDYKISAAVLIIMILNKYRRKCKEKYEVESVESSQLYFKKSERGSRKKHDSGELDP